eukprot:CAMPEP_0178406682 /NCGR_PEP_ID=MMETSP0689_2-20121128/19038_1 /TAXON_ID=160604 /ORGANISM="Amphidinium massartii, Strain CS-259" /LENGTH=914 /DNA_ID=CAMNT_0020027731 /DNA_START=10 /DNA_END=2754 /DNA_ORIENTATION=+
MAVVHKTKCEVLSCQECDSDEHKALVLSLSYDGDLVSSEVTSKGTFREEWREILLRSGGKVTAVALSHDGNLLAVGLQPDETTFETRVWAMDKESCRPVDTVRPKQVARAQLAIRCLHWHPSKQLLAIGSDSGETHFWHAEERSSTSDSIKGKLEPRGWKARECAVRGIAMAPEGVLAAVADDNGMLAIYRDSEEVHSSQLWRKGSGAFRMGWDPTGVQLALPRQQSVILLSALDFSSRAVPMEEVHNEPIVCVAWSAQSLLAAASRDAISMWATSIASQDYQLSKRFSVVSTPCSLLWSNEVLAIGGLDGSVTLLSRHPEKQDETDTGLGLPNQPHAVEEAEEGNAQPPAQGLAQEPTPGVQEPAETSTAAEEQREEQEEQEEEEEEKEQVQELIHPGASKGEARRKFLAWNEHGQLKIFRAKDEKEKEKSSRDRKRKKETPSPLEQSDRVEIEYSNSKYRSTRTQRAREVVAPEGTTLGALGPGLAALAAGGNVVVHVANAPVRTTASSAVVHALPQGEEVAAMALSESFLAIATQPSGNLRVNTITGVPIGVFSLPGQIVCLAARGDVLFVVTSAGSILDFALYGVTSQERLASGTLPLSRSARLRWAGFTPDCQPLTLDSDGVLRALSLTGPPGSFVGAGVAEWFVLAELDGKGQNLWPVEADESNLLCAPVEQPGGSPRVGSTLTLQKVPYRTCLGSEPLDKVFQHNSLQAQRSFAAVAGLAAGGPQSSHRKRPAPSAAAPERRVKQCGDQVSTLCNSLITQGDVEQAHDVAKLFFEVLGNSSSETLRMFQSARVRASTVKQDGLWTALKRISDSVELKHKRMSAEASVQAACAPPAPVVSSPTLAGAAESKTEREQAMQQESAPILRESEESRRRTIEENKARAIERKRRKQAEEEAARQLQAAAAVC